MGLTNNKEKFYALSGRVGFDDEEKELLWEGLQDVFESMRQLTPAPALSVPIINNNHSMNNNRNQRYHPNQHNPENSVYAIPNNKNESISTLKRKTFDFDDLLLSEEDDIKPPKQKKRKTQKKNVQTLWSEDSEITDKEQRKLEKEAIFIVESIIGHKQSGNKYKYNVKWEGYDDITWEPEEHINSYLITNYWKNKGIKVDKEGAMLHLNKITKNEKKKKKKKEKKSIKKTMSKTKTKKSMKKKKGHKAAKHSKKKKQKRTKTAKKLYWEDSDVEQDDEESDNSNC